MPKQTQEFLVFVGSPGDCEAEREAVRSTAEAVSAACGIHVDVRIHVAGWEHVQPDLGRPQGHINPLIDECDLFVGILNRRWGTSTGTHSSGFLEEFERVVDRRGGGDHPQIAVFFKSLPMEAEEDPGPELQKVLAFKEQLVSQKVALFRTFDSPANLSVQLWGLFADHILRLHPHGGAPSRPQGSNLPSEEAQVSNEPESLTDVDLEEHEVGPHETDEARRQVAAATESLTAAVRGAAPSNDLDRDRILLIALGVNSDGGPLPVHVANRLYLRREALVLSVMEEEVWLRTLLSDVARTPRNGRVVPGWGVVVSDEDVTYYLTTILVEHLGHHDEDVAVGAARVLERLQLRPGELWPELQNQPPGEDYEGPPSYSGSALWAQLFVRQRLGRALEAYIAVVAGPDDVQLVAAIAAAGGSEALGALAETLAGRPEAVAATVARKGGEAWQQTVLMDRLSQLSPETLHTVATGPGTTTDLRRAAVNRLLHESLLVDSMLPDLLRRPSNADLVADWADQQGGTAWARIAAALATEDFAGREFKELRSRALCNTTPTDVLASRLRGTEGFGIWHALGWSRDGSLLGMAREVFDQDGQPVLQAWEDAQLWAEDRRLEEYLREQARLAALRILLSADKPLAEDLDRLKAEVLKDGLSQQEVVVLLADKGGPNELAEMLAALPAVYPETQQRLAARILEVGGTAAAWQLFQSTNVSELRVTALRRLSDASAVTESEYMDLLYDPDDHVRLAALDGLRVGMTRQDLRSLIQIYATARDSYYYNVVAELDWISYAELPACGG